MSPSVIPGPITPTKRENQKRADRFSAVPVILGAKHEHQRQKIINSQSHDKACRGAYKYLPLLAFRKENLLKQRKRSEVGKKDIPPTIA